MGTARLTTTALKQADMFRRAVGRKASPRPSPAPGRAEQPPSWWWCQAISSVYCPLSAAIWRIASARRLLGTPEGSARREFELLLLLGGSRKAAVQLWLRKQRIYANAQQAAGRPATEAKGPRGAAERQAGGESKPETAAQAARRHRSERRLREKHLARKW